MYQHRQMTLPLLLSVYYRYYRSGPSSTGYRNIRTSEDDDLLHRYGLLRFDCGSQGWICGMGSLQESADDGCGPAGEIKIFKNVVLAHYLDY